MAKPSTPRHDSRALSRIQRGLEERTSWWNRILELPLLWAALAVLCCGWLLQPTTGNLLPTWEPGEVASFDVTVPRDMSLQDEAATERARQEARDEVLPVYDHEPRLQLEMVEELRQLFLLCAETMQDDEEALDGLAVGSHLAFDSSMLQVLRSSECSAELEAALLDVVGQVYRARIVDDRRALENRGDSGVTVRNLNIGSEMTVPLNDMSEVIDFRSGLETVLRNRLLELDAVRRRWIRPTVGFLEANLEPNLVFNRAETATRVEAAAAQVTQRSQVLRRGQILIRRGDTVTPAVARTLRMINEQRQELTTHTQLIGIVLLLAIMMVGMWRVLGRIGVSTEGRNRLSMLFILVVLFVCLNRFFIFLATAVAQQSQATSFSAVDSYLWGVPYAAGAITVVLLLGMQAAVLFALCEALIAGLMLGGDFTVLVYALASALAGALAAREFKDRIVFARVGVLIGAMNVAVMLILQLYGGLRDPLGTMAVGAAWAFLGGLFSAVAIATFVLPVLERIFGITTVIRLLELSNQNLPLLKRLSLEAPGTYQHSLAVGNLAEAGADAVGADSLVLRVCAYYHDIGKLFKPKYFVENQRGGNPHDSLSPSMSSLVIQSHVKEGLQMARKERLPLPIRQAVATHHGTKLIRFFFDKAAKQQDPELGEVRESDYRYPGPKPHTKELGILLLADAVEAAARTIENPTPSKIQNMINRIFADALTDGQLDNTELTFSELDKVASAFMWVLTNMYHHRIEYPGFDFNRKQEKRDSGVLQMGPKTVATDG